jgi:hypothetical protein
MALKGGQLEIFHLIFRQIVLLLMRGLSVRTSPSRTTQKNKIKHSCLEWDYNRRRPCAGDLPQCAPKPHRNWYHYFQCEEQNIMRHDLENCCN